MAIDRIVIVTDDDEDIRESVAILLRDEGIDVRTAEHGGAALEHLAALGDGRCVLLLDLMMRPVSGGDVIDVLEREGRLPALPVIVCTASSDSALASRARHVLHKPFVLERLLALLDQACSPPASEARMCAEREEPELDEPRSVLAS